MKKIIGVWAVATGITVSVLLLLSGCYNADGLAQDEANWGTHTLILPSGRTIECVLYYVEGGAAATTEMQCFLVEEEPR